MDDHKMIKITKEYKFEIRHSPEEEPGIYIVYGFTDHNNGNQIRYVGESNNIKNRMSGHEKEDCWKKNQDDIEIYVYKEENESIRKHIEQNIIDELKPPCNDQ